jgi:arabinosyltransferase
MGQNQQNARRQKQIRLFRDIFVFIFLFLFYCYQRTKRVNDDASDFVDDEDDFDIELTSSDSSTVKKYDDAKHHGGGMNRLVEESDVEGFESSDEERVDPSPPLPSSPDDEHEVEAPSSSSSSSSSGSSSALFPPPIIKSSSIISKQERTTMTLAGEGGDEKNRVGNDNDGNNDNNSFDVLPRPDQNAINSQEVRSDTNHPKWMKDMWAEQTKALTEEARKELERKIYEGAIPQELSHAKPGDTIFVTFATHSVRDFAKNWVNAVRKLKLEPYFVGALDEKMLEDLRKWNVPSMLLTGNSVLQDRGVKFITAGSQAFKKMGTVKTKFVQDLLDMNLNPILSDADVVWLRDPRDYFNKGTYKVADILVSTDCIDVPGDKMDSNRCAHVNFNTGILHFRATEESKVFLQTWKTKVATSTIAWMRDQPAFNLITHEGVRGHTLEPAVKLKDERNDKGKEGSRMIYYAANATVKLGVLPNWLFGNGHSYFVQWHHKKFPEDGEPFAVHTTYQYGDDGQYAWGKRERMRQAGIWTADEDEYYEDTKTKYLVVPDRFAQVRHQGASVTVGSGKDDYRVAIERHFAEDRVRRETVRNLLALGRLLGRTVILPEPRCYCDKIWNNLNACRAPGAELFVLPYSCPMDHIYDLPQWFKQNLQFREPGFLTDSRVPDSIRTDVIHVSVERKKNSKLILEGDRDSKPTPTAPAETYHPASAADVTLPFGFTAQMAEEALKPFESHAVLEFDYLAEEGTFCGFQTKEENKKFDQSVRSPLSHYQYYCFTEPWLEANAPRSGRHKDEPYEPQVVKRHCGEMDSLMRSQGKVHLGVLEHVNKEKPLQCTCEFGFGTPTPMTDVADSGLCTHDSHVSTEYE